MHWCAFKAVLPNRKSFLQTSNRCQTNIFWYSQILVSITYEGTDGQWLYIWAPGAHCVGPHPPSSLPQSARGASSCALNTRALVALVQLALWSQMLRPLNRSKRNGLPTATAQAAVVVQQRPKWPLPSPHVVGRYRTGPRYCTSPVAQCEAAAVSSTEVATP